MSLYRALYEGDPNRESAPPPKPRPTKGLGLLWWTLRHNWWSLIKVNILFWAFCLPLVTAPAALKAMTRVCMTLLRGQPCEVWPDWWSAFREGFLRTTALGAALAAALGALGYGAWFYIRAMAENGLLAFPAFLLVVAAAVVAMSLPPIFLLLEFSELKAGDAVRSGVLLTLVRLPQSLAVLAVLAGMTAAYLLAYPWSSFVLGGIALSLFWLIACFAAWPGLEKYVFHLTPEPEQHSGGPGAEA